jgi:hypothetical protein
VRPAHRHLVAADASAFACDPRHLPREKRGSFAPRAAAWNRHAQSTVGTNTKDVSAGPPHPNELDVILWDRIDALLRNTRGSVGRISSFGFDLKRQFGLHACRKL